MFAIKFQHRIQYNLSGYNLSSPLLFSHLLSSPPLLLFTFCLASSLFLFLFIPAISSPLLSLVSVWLLRPLLNHPHLPSQMLLAAAGKPTPLPHLAFSHTLIHTHTHTHTQLDSICSLVIICFWLSFITEQPFDSKSSFLILRLSCDIYSSYVKGLFTILHKTGQPGNMQCIISFIASSVKLSIIFSKQNTELNHKLAINILLL